MGNFQWMQGISSRRQGIRCITSSCGIVSPMWELCSGSVCARPDLSAAVEVLASHMSCNPDETLKSLKAMWRHLRYTQDLGFDAAAERWEGDNHF